MNLRRERSLASGKMGFPCHRPDQVPVLLWLLLLILAPGREQSGTLPKAFLLLEPPWSRTFKGEIVNLTCKDDHSWAQGYVSWYYNKISLGSRPGTIQIDKSGYYSCKTPRSSFSDPVRVEFLSDWLILQASHPVFEGDDVTLRCLAKKEKKTYEKTFYKNKKKMRHHSQSEVTIHSVSRDNNEYHCTVSSEYFWSPWKETSKALKIQVQELFPQPVLRARPSQPIEGNPVNLKCETWLPPPRSYIWLRFCFFREDKVLEPGWSNSSELQIPTMWSEDSGSYWCQAKTATSSIIKESLRSQIHVQRIPVSDVNLEIQPPGDQLIEGGDMVLICSVAKGTGTIAFSWHREGTERSLGRKMVRALSAELRIAAVREQDAGRYYCSADNIQGPILSKRIRVTPKIPASHPILTVKTPRALAVVGDMVELRCEAQRGSPPILYRYYHEDVILGTNSAPSGGGASFNLSLTAEHSGNYACEADNSLRAQRSEAVMLSVTVPVSRPVLTFNPARPQVVVGDLLELRCEVQRGSPPILYWFYHEDVILGNTSAPSGGGASFNLSLTTEHSGNYSCGADNGLGVQRSYMVTLNFTGLSTSKVIHITVGFIGCLLSVSGLAATAYLVRYFRTQRKSGRLPATGTPSIDCRRKQKCGLKNTLFLEICQGFLQESYSPKEHQEPSWSGPCSTDPHTPPHSEPPAVMEPQPVYSNVNPGDDNLVYSQIWSSQQTKGNPDTVSSTIPLRGPAYHTQAWIHGLARSPRTHRRNEEPAVIYSELKKAQPEDTAGQAHEDPAENYENLPCAPSALDH
ncbi:Fc receptor-like protein 3 isoform X4 [Mustela erminea]|uniref:Fc receptor-like protein 3 isoform X4 n=1 Tax=Mustela erminea TaxID=36723 RepID=UPI0013866700|nr:Fc receptor-like protein 3 isoform X4 [Mustela erminea]